MRLLFLPKPPPTPTLLLFLLLSSLLFTTLCLNKIQLQQRHSSLLKKSQLITFNQLQIDNFFNYQYYARMQLGTPNQREDVILDTGSHHLWVPAKNCTNCPITMRKFDHRKSSTVKVSNKREQLAYGKGEIKGFYVEESLIFDGINTTFSLILADYQKDTEHSQADGIMGLSNYKKIKNVFDVFKEQGDIVSSKFAFQLGLKQLKEKSYFYYNISENDFSQASYINASKKDYWTIPIRDITVQNVSFSTIKHALVDSGTSLVLIPSDLYGQLDVQVFSKFCDPFQLGNIRKCKCPSSAQYPNITILSDRLSFNITSSSYILGSYNNKLCMLGIDKLSEQLPNIVILGDIFFHHQLIIFDKENNRIGFVSNHKVVNLYPNSNVLVWIMNVLVALAVLVVLFVLGMRKQKPENSMLEEPLRIGGTVEMTSPA